MLEGFVSFLGMGARIYREIWATWTLFHKREPSSKSISIPFSKLFFKKDNLGFFIVCHIEVYLGAKVVESALIMLALYMYFNGTAIRGSETKMNLKIVFL